MAELELDSSAGQVPDDVKVVRPKVLSVSIKDKKTLHSAFMPFLKNGGIFVPTDNRYLVGDEVFLILKLMDGAQFAVSGIVSWTTPTGAQASRTAGVGIHLQGSEGAKLKEYVQTELAEFPQPDRPTHTL
jgi:type IV pilus assembly protein PilZ|tara:strand:+ start:693 stop:1082 length:390 start_codon:yes stop_codon:yes gene_type:complete